MQQNVHTSKHRSSHGRLFNVLPLFGHSALPSFFCDRLTICDGVAPISGPNTNDDRLISRNKRYENPS